MNSGWNTTEEMTGSGFSKDTGEIHDEEVKVLSVSDLNGLIKKSMEGQFALVWLRAEISNFKPHSSGHFYFSLKDERSQILAVMFKGFNARLNFKPRDGMEVIVRGRISVYEPRGNYQILVEKMDEVGAGSLQKAFEQLKQKLAHEGLFSIENKKNLPSLPKKIALITSPTGAAVRDMIHVLGRRYKALEILVIPSLTQGDGAAQSLIRSVQLLERLDCDVAIIGRGGGSIEDMWCFNDENLARAIYACPVPLVSAVGHEIDFTICDFVCDVRAPTPSAAAEIVSQSVETVLEDIRAKERMLGHHFKTQLLRWRSALSLNSQKLVDPKRRLQDLRLLCDDYEQKLLHKIRSKIQVGQVRAQSLWERLLGRKTFVNQYNLRLNHTVTRLQPALQTLLQNKNRRFQSQVELLDSLNPLSILHRGYAVIRKSDANGVVLKSAKDIKLQDTLWVGLHQGSVKTQVVEIKENEKWQMK